MKVILINGSTRKGGCVYTALGEVARALNLEGVETEILQMGAEPVRDCTGCDYCHTKGNGKCVFSGDCVNGWIDKVVSADGIVLGSPVYFAHPTGQLQAALDRLFYAAGDSLAYKPGAAVVTARRAGTTASLDVLNKYFTDACMPVVSSTYWNMAHGTSPEQILKDDEGLQTMRNVGKNMAWLLKCIQAGRAAGVPMPVPEKSAWTNFIR